MERKRNCMDFSNNKTSENLTREKFGTGLIATQKQCHKGPTMVETKMEKTKKNNGRIRSDRDETIYHIISECSKLTLKRVQDRAQR